MKMKDFRPVHAGTAGHFIKAFVIALLALVFAGTFGGQTVHAAPATVDLDDGTYAIEFTMTGGSGKAAIVSPARMFVVDGEAFVECVWSSSNYDYMVVDGQQYLNEKEEGYSTFTVPITAFDEPVEYIADTIAMGTPHEVTYEIVFDSSSIASADTLPQEAAKRVVIMAAIIIAVGGVLNHFVNKRNSNDFKKKK